MKQQSIWSQEGQRHLAWDGCHSLSVSQLNISTMRISSFFFNYRFIMFLTIVSDFFIIITQVALLQSGCAAPADPRSRGTQHWEAAQGAVFSTSSGLGPAMLTATHGAETGNEQHILISPSNHSSWQPFLSRSWHVGDTQYADGGLTCLWVYTNDSPAINTGHPELPFCVDAHPIGHLLLLF